MGDSGDSSDENFAWGKFTVEEIKNDLLNSSIYKPPRRYSDSYYTSDVCLKDYIKLAEEREFSSPVGSTTYATSFATANEQIKTGSILTNYNSDHDTSYFSALERQMSKSTLNLSSVYVSLVSDTFVEGKSEEKCIVLSDEEDESEDCIIISDDDNEYSVAEEIKQEVDEMSSKLTDLSANKSFEHKEFDNTLDEMNYLLEQQGLDKLMESNSTTTTSNKSFISSHIPVPIKPSVNEFAGVVKKTFKTPNVPKAKKSAWSSAKKYQNIVSPVGIYIKNDTNPFLKENLNPKSKMSLKFSECKENIGGGNGVREKKFCIPSVFYKPSERILTGSDKVVNLPQNIEKLVKNQPMVVQHVGRTGNLNILDTTSIPVSEDDLTLVNISNMDYSLVYEKRAFQ